MAEYEVTISAGSLRLNATVTGDAEKVVAFCRKVVEAAEENTSFFAYEEVRPYVRVYPRKDVDPKRVMWYIQQNFQMPGSHDRGPDDVRKIEVYGGNPFVNAKVEVTT